MPAGFLLRITTMTSSSERQAESLPATTISASSEKTEPPGLVNLHLTFQPSSSEGMPVMMSVSVPRPVQVTFGKSVLMSLAL